LRNKIIVRKTSCGEPVKLLKQLFIICQLRIRSEFGFACCSGNFKIAFYCMKFFFNKLFYMQESTNFNPGFRFFYKLTLESLLETFSELDFAPRRHPDHLSTNRRPQPHCQQPFLFNEQAASPKPQPSAKWFLVGRHQTS